MKKRLVAYPAIFDDTDNNNQVYSVSFPDVPSALTFGTGMASSIDRASEVLGLSLFDIDDLPEVSDLEQLRKDNPDVIVNMVSADLEDARIHSHAPYIRKNTSLPADLAQEAEARHLNFSEILADALRKKLQI